MCGQTALCGFRFFPSAQMKMHESHANSGVRSRLGFVSLTLTSQAIDERSGILAPSEVNV